MLAEVRAQVPVLALQALVPARVLVPAQVLAQVLA